MLIETATIAAGSRAEAIAESVIHGISLKCTERNGVALGQPFIGAKIHRGTYAQARAGASLKYSSGMKATWIYKTGALLRKERERERDVIKRYKENT